MRKKRLKPRYKQAFMGWVNVIKNDKNGKNLSMTNFVILYKLFCKTGII